MPAAQVGEEPDAEVAAAAALPLRDNFMLHETGGDGEGLSDGLARALADVLPEPEVPDVVALPEATGEDEEEHKAPPPAAKAHAPATKVTPKKEKEHQLAKDKESLKAPPKASGDSHADQSCVVVESLDFHQDNHLLSQKEVSSEQACCKECYKDSRCAVALVKKGRCYLQRLTPERESFSSPGTTALAVPGRAAPVDTWGPPVWERNKAECLEWTKNQPPVEPLLETGRQPGMPPVVWRAYQTLAHEQRARLLKEKPGSSDDSASSAADPFDLVRVVVPMVQPLPATKAKFSFDVDQWAKHQEEVKHASVEAGYLLLALCVDAKLRGSVGLDVLKRKVGEIFVELQSLGLWVGARQRSLQAACMEFTLLNTRLGTGRDAYPQALWKLQEEQSQKAMQKLAKAAGGMLEGPVFQDVDVALTFTPPVIDHEQAHGSGQGAKNLVGMSEGFMKEGQTCITYGIGINRDSRFEQKMAALGCETHGFDCTVNPEWASVKDVNFNFHRWCIGEAPSNKAFGKEYSRNAVEEFKTLAETMRFLNHTHINLLKFDIEGYEWKLFDDVLLKSNGLRIEQISFELHSAGASRRFVPKHLVNCRGRSQVAKLFLRLYNLGYRVVSKEVNSGDPNCAEFVLLNVKY